MLTGVLRALSMRVFLRWEASGTNPLGLFGRDGRVRWPSEATSAPRDGHEKYSSLGHTRIVLTGHPCFEEVARKLERKETMRLLWRYKIFLALVKTMKHCYESMGQMI